MKDSETLINDLQAELDEVSGRLVKLVSFLNKEGASVSPRQREMLVMQRRAMTDYTDVLRNRIIDIKAHLAGPAEFDARIRLEALRNEVRMGM